MDSRSFFHHALTVDRDKCRGCTHCMKKCPTQAIRIINGKAHVDPKRCIDCGVCMDVCPHKAIGIEQERFNQIFTYPRRVAIIPSLLIGQFEEEYSEEQIINALYDLGFTDVYYGEFGADILRVLGKSTSGYADETPVISSYCPAVIRLIQLSYPSLLPNVNLLRTPAQITALYVREKLEREGVDSEDIGIFYVSGCAAKVGQILTWKSKKNSLIQGGLNLDTLCNILLESVKKHSVNDKERRTYHPVPFITEQSFLWSLVGGESREMSHRTLAIDEIHNVTEFLELVEDDRHEEIDFLELRSCDTGCTGGILAPRNRFLATQRIRYQATKHPSSIPRELSDEILSFKDTLIREIKGERFPQHHALQLDTDPQRALVKLEKVNEIEKILPGIDCGLCGYPSCRTLSEEIAQGNASIRSCCVLKMKHPKQFSRLEKIWGDVIQKR
ncbi:MAG: [Fe-Fe] hydrogenase large subunit C-terminal domain-containing protein [Sphaerochaetaceae bacterium]|nr:[Fe-Fe] hydrogenase large subunit C-terminal domain-containing protein [Sphaerochaetaceae bacterium]